MANSEQSTSGIKQLVRNILPSNGNSDEKDCKHYELTGPRPGIDTCAEAPIWYKRSEERGDESYWTEKDVAYVKTREVAYEFVCLGCGEVREMSTGELIGGPEGIKLKGEMSDAELQEFRENIHSGAFFNGWPENHWMSRGDG